MITWQWVHALKHNPYPGQPPAPDGVSPSAGRRRGSRRPET